MAKKAVKRRSWTPTDVKTLRTLARKKTHAGRMAITLKRTEGARHQKEFSMDLSLHARCVSTSYRRYARVYITHHASPGRPDAGRDFSFQVWNYSCWRFASETKINNKPTLMLQGRHTFKQINVEPRSCHPTASLLAVRFAVWAWRIEGCMVNSLRIRKSFRSRELATTPPLEQTINSTKQVKPSCNWSRRPPA